MTGEIGDKGLAFAEKMVPWFEAMSKGATTHPDESTSTFMGVLIQTGNLYELCVQHERWDYETIYGLAGSILVKAAREYNYDVSRSMRMARRQLYAYVT